MKGDGEDENDKPYSQIEGKKFKPIGHPNAKQAEKLLEAGRKRFQHQS